MKLRVVVTDASEWNFDYDTMMYLRSPREGEAESAVPYSGEWEPFEEIEELDDQFGHRLLVHRPVPWGTGARRLTGDITSDTGVPLTEFTSVDHFEIAGRGMCYTINNPGGYPEPNVLTGTTVVLDGRIRKVVGVETFAIGRPYPESLGFALLVAEDE